MLDWFCPSTTEIFIIEQHPLNSFYETYFYLTLGLCSLSVVKYSFKAFCKLAKCQSDIKVEEYQDMYDSDNESVISTKSDSYLVYNNNPLFYKHF